MDDGMVGERVNRAEELLGRLESLAGTPAGEVAIEAVQALVELYGEGLARIVVAGGPDLVARLDRDDLVRHLLILHDLHPAGTAERVESALDEVRPYLQSHGGDVELVEVDGTIARVRLHGSCDGCPSSAATMQGAVEETVRRAAPELESVVAVPAESAKPAGFIPLTAVGARR